jgi:hypothetical protein
MRAKVMPALANRCDIDTILSQSEFSIEREPITTEPLRAQRSSLPLGDLCVSVVHRCEKCGLAVMGQNVTEPVKVLFVRRLDDVSDFCGKRLVFEYLLPCDLCAGCMLGECDCQNKMRLG